MAQKLKNIIEILWIAVSIAAFMAVIIGALKLQQACEEGDKEACDTSDIIHILGD